MMYNDVRKNENKGFSLVELIVVVAIMAVLVAVLAPSLLAYVERTRAQKDDSAMGEVANAIMLALANQDAYDEALVYTRDGNYSSYVDDKNKNGATADNSEFTKGTAQWWFKDNARLQDEDLYDLAGVMRGVTVTFYPEAASTKQSTFKLTNGIVNHAKDATPTTFGAMTAGDGQHYLCNMVRATVVTRLL
jgi:prepilin-type N-terminal cleavage/methylation domain-containing protein